MKLKVLDSFQVGAGKELCRACVVDVSTWWFPGQV